MKRKMLIAIALIAIMLLSCVAPMLQAQAATSKTTISFNTALYKGLKSYFQEQGVSAVYNDGLHTIKMENSTIAGIEELSLKEKGIKDLTGLDVFTGVKRLILSGNDLDESSNLGILNNFANLVYLDLSSNQISDITEIQSLVERLLGIDSNAINLTGQVVKLVVDIPLDSEQEEERVECEMPQILQFAGIAENSNIRNKGNLKADWTRGKYYTKSSVSGKAPSIVAGTIPNPVTAENNKFEIEVGLENASGYTSYEGLIKWVISIKDTSFDSYNVNPASENILKDSIFTLYYVVHSDAYEGVIFKDNNLYTAVRDQLTKGQTINNELLSYSYTTEEDGEIYFDICDLSLSGTTATLRINGEVQYIIKNFNQAGYDGASTIYYSDGTRRYPLQDYDVVYVDTINSSGVVTRTLKVKVPHYNADSRNLYVDAYDEPYALVITDLDIINKIVSLILNDKRIVDLSGLEKFVGLESNLNVSFNYIDTLATIYALQLNKEANNSSLQEAYKERREAMASTKNTILSAYGRVDASVKAIKEEIKNIENIINVEYPALDSTAENYKDEVAKLVTKILDINKKIEGDGGENKGLIEELDKALTDPQDGLNPNLSKIYPRLAAMYTVFNKEYKLTSLLTPELNYQTEEEYEALKEKMKSREEAMNLVTSEVSRISSYESAGALSDLDKSLITNAFGLILSSEEENPIGKALNDYVKNLKEMNAARSVWTGMIDKFIEINIYSQSASYCLLERMNNSVAAGACFAEKYLAGTIKEFNYEGIDTEVLTAVYEKLTTGATEHRYTESLYDIFAAYEAGTRTCTSGIANFCRGTYYGVSRLNKLTTEATKTLGDTSVSYINSIKLIEILNSVGENNRDIYFYQQLMALANKFTASDEVDRYIVLPALKRIDVRNNEIRSLGDTQVTMVKEDGSKETTTENLATLKNLKELYAGHNMITGDIQSIDWASLKAFKRLDLSYNYITDIMPLQVLTNLRYLDVSDNLLEGPFTLRLKEMPKLEDLILAGNKITDISQILTDYEMDADGNFTDYFAREDTLNLDISRQEFEIDLTDAIAYAEDTSVYEVELPPIFAQLEFIDATRTAYGTTSSKGTITARGGYAYVPVSKTGEYAGIVKVIAANGYPEDVTTSIGIDTTCTIKYVVKNIRVDSVKIDGETTRMEAGTSRTFTATVAGENVPDTTVEWDIVSEHSEGTTISQDGTLTVAEDEPATELVIEATSNYDDSVKDTITLEVYRRIITNIAVTGPDAVITGKTGEYIATVEGTDLQDENKNVTWSIVGNTSPDTKIEIIEPVETRAATEQPGETGEATEQPTETEEDNNIGGAILTVGKDEQADSITVVATSTFDTEKTGTLEVAINKKKITGVTISGESAIRTGNTETYLAEVTGEFLDEADKEVEWKIISPVYDRYYSPDTKLEVIQAVEGEEVENVGGAKFTVAQNELIEEFVIEAASKFDGTKYDTFTIAINKKSVTGVEITNATEAIVSGKTGEYTAEVTGEFLDEADGEVTWSISGNTSQNTTIEKIVAVEGQDITNVGGAKLTIGLDEQADKVTVRATSNLDSTKYAEYEVTVNKKEVTKVKVYEQGVTITLDGRGKTSMFTEVVEGNFLEEQDRGITWSITGNTSSTTRITDNGVLIVAEDETADSITVIATSNFDNTKNGTSVVTIIRKEATSVTVNEQDRTVRKGRTYKYTATVEGNHLEAADKGVTWSVSGRNSEGEEVAVNEYTVINDAGSLTVGVGETATTLVVKATSKFDTSKSGASVATISDIGADLPEVLGYEIDSDDEIVGVSPDTSASSFKSKYVTESGYTVKVTRNGVELQDGESVATGDIAVILKEGVMLATNDIVVKGDINGDGTVTEADSRLVKSHRAKLTTLTGLYFKAADIDRDGELTISDVRLILAHRAKISGYIL